MKRGIRRRILRGLVYDVNVARDHVGYLIARADGLPFEGGIECVLVRRDIRNGKLAKYATRIYWPPRRAALPA
jgi:hypothetical protein